MSSYGLEIIDHEQCVELLHSQVVGRVGLASSRPGVFPVLYAMLGDDVVFRTAPGDKLIAAVLHHNVVFEIDAFDVVDHTGWSVNVVGPIEEILLPDDQARVDALDLQSWAGDSRDRYVRIRSVAVSGRRICAVPGE